MRTNAIVLNNTLAPLISAPFFTLPKEKQGEIRDTLLIILSKFESGLQKEQAEQTTVGVRIQELQSLLKKPFLNEYIFVQTLQKLLDPIFKSRTDKVEQILWENLERLVERVKPYAQSQEVARTTRAGLSGVAIKAHDQELLKNQMQFYAFDYFLMMHMALIAVGKSEQIKMINSGIQGAPALVTDALQNDMLSKIVYELYDEDLRQRMIIDYYVYRQSFAELDKPENIIAALKTYCLSLIDISLESGITTFTNSIFKPVGEVTDFQKIRQQLLSP